MSAAVDDPLLAERGRLFGLSYRMLGSAGEAEDIVQEAYLRWYARPRPEVENPRAFLTTVVTHLCLDHLRSAQHRREQYPGVWLPEPLAPDDLEADDLRAARNPATPEDDLEKLESISLAFLSLLQSLSPLERAVYVLAEVFDYSHAEVAEVIGRTPAACRQALRRAKQSLAAGRRDAAPAERHRELLGSFIAACRSGDIDNLTRLLAEDVVSRADGGGQVKATNRPVVGVRAVSRLYVGLRKVLPRDLVIRIETVNGWPTALMSSGGFLVSTLQIRVQGERIVRIDNVVNPAKLARVAKALGMRTVPPGETS